MSEFKNLKDFFKSTHKCDICQKDMALEVAAGKYNDITEFGHKNHIVKHRLTKNHLKLSRTIEVEEKRLTMTLIANLNDNTFSTKFLPTEDEIVNLFPVVPEFFELSSEKFLYAMDKGVINVWKVMKKFSEPFYLINSCPGHVKKVTVLDFNHESLLLEEIVTYDEYYYVPNTSNNEVYAIHDHCSPATKDKRVVFVISVKGNELDNLDTRRGGIWLREPDDNHLMNFDFTNIPKLSRKLNLLYALKG